jgi:DNA-directed RNA polymerase specialized sigma24 family protein
MARDAAIEARLLRWAEAVTIGDASGYASVCTLHESWSPPVAGQRPTLKVGVASDVGETHRAIGRLSLRLRNAIVVHYCIKGPVARQAELMECAPDTVHDRIERAHHALLGILQEFCNIHEPG